MDEINTNAGKIETIITQIDELLKNIDKSGLEKASAIMDYDKAIAVTTLQLRNGSITEYEGESLSNLPATLIPSIAKGICYQQIYSRELADASYKSLITKIESLKAMLNGYQSILKYIE